MNTVKVARRHVGRAASLMFAVLATVLVCQTARAQSGTAVTVKTLSGGPSQQNPFSFSGNADGDTVNVAQFNNPAGLALNPAGTILYVADIGNGEIRILDLVGLQTTSLVITTNGVGVVPVDVATDASSNLYVLLPGSAAFTGFIVKLNERLEGVTAVNSQPLNSPSAMAMDGAGNIYVTEMGGAVKKVNIATGNVSTNLVSAGVLLRPQGIAVLDDGRLVVSDTGHYVIRVIDPALSATNNMKIYAGTLDRPGFNETDSGLPVGFSDLHHIAKAGGGVIVVADGGNTISQSQKVRTVDSAGNTGTLYGVIPSQWVSPPDLPGWVDSGNPGKLPPEARDPNGVAVDSSGNVYVSEDFYDILRKVTSTGLTGPNGSGSGTNVVVSPPTLSISPNSGYFPMGQTITVTSTSTNVYFTFDGTLATTNSTPVLMSGGVGFIQLGGGTNDLTHLNVLAVNFSGAASASTNVSGLPAPATTIGAVAGIQPTIVAGIGSTAIVPVVLNLRPTDQIESLVFHVEIAPGVGAPPGISSNFQVLPVSTNDFITVTTSANPGGATNFTTTPYTIGATRGILVDFVPNGNLLLKNFAVACLLAVPIPPGAAVGNTYTISVLSPSGTSDANQTIVPVTSGTPQTILVSNISYVVGDTSPGRWYSAGDFGNGGLNSADVNNAFFASLGIRVPYTFSDAFDAMDAFPEDSPGTAGGDGQIRFLDWQIILLRSQGLNTVPSFGISPTNWTRSWSVGGVRTNNTTALGSAQSVAKSLALLPGNVWNRQAAVGAFPGGNFQPGSTSNIPVFVKVYPGVAVPVAGLEFHATVTPNGNAPAVTSAIHFIPALGGSTANGPLSLNELASAWNLPTLNLAASSSNFLGWIQFSVPATAQPGQTYNIQFDHVDGAPNFSTQYDFESFTSTITVGGTVAPFISPISDEWKIRFFGSTTNPMADPNADPDGDGVPNWVEFLAGTDPTDANSHLSLASGGVRNSGQSVALELLSAPGKVYVLETCPAFGGTNTWNPVLTNMGDGSLREFIRDNAGGSQFYRIRVQQ